MPRRNNEIVQVFKTERGWVVQRMGGLRASFIFDYKDQAVSKAREYRYQGCDVYIYNQYGGLDTILNSLT